MGFVINNSEANEILNKLKKEPKNPQLIEEAVEKIILPVASMVVSKLPFHIRDDVQQDLVVHFLTYKDSFLRSYKGGNCFRFFQSSLWQQTSSILKKRKKKNEAIHVVSDDDLEKLSAIQSGHRFQGSMKREYDEISTFINRVITWAKIRFPEDEDRNRVSKYIQKIIENGGKQRGKIARQIATKEGVKKIKMVYDRSGSIWTRSLSGLAYNVLVHFSSIKMRLSGRGPLTGYLVTYADED